MIHPKKIIKPVAQSDSEDYIMRQPKRIFWMGVVCSLFFIVILVFFLIFFTVVDSKELGFWEITGFSLLALTGILLCLSFSVYSAKWKIIVEKDIFTVFSPFRPSRIITLSEISQVRQKFNGIVIYVNGKRAFAVDNIANGFNVFCARLYEAGKMEGMQCKDGFVVRQHKGNIVIGILGFLVGVSFLIWNLFWSDDTMNWLICIFYSAFTMFALCLFIHSLLWRITVSKDMITVKNVLGGEKEYPIREITKVNVGKEKITLFIDDKKIAKAVVSCVGVPILIERLKNEKIPFYSRGHLIER